MFESGIESMMDGSVFTRERPVFVARDNRRARRLRYGGAAAAILACLWLAALAVGMLGTGRLPGLSLPSGVRGAEHGVREPAPARVERSSPRAQATPRQTSEPRVSRRSDAVGQEPRVRQAPARPALRQAVNRIRNVRDVAPPVLPIARPAAPQAAPPPAPAPAPAPAALPKQGWARQGQTAPPGQTRRAETQLAPAPAPAPTTPQPLPAPPGQQRKAEDPKPKG